MTGKSRDIFSWYRLLPGIFLAGLLLSGCSATRNAQDPTAPVSTSTDIPQATLTSSQIPQPTALPTSTPAPAVTQVTSTEPKGLVIFSLTDGLYRHLFAYHPSLLPLTRLTGDAWNFKDPAVSPDGRQIAYCADQTGTWQIFILNLTTGATLQVTQSGEYNCAPTWSPDGKWLAFERYNGSNSDLILQSIEDPATTPIQLTSEGGNNYEPAWSPSGREIAFVTDRSGREEIWLARLDAPDDRFMVIRADPKDNFSSPAWSPDGKKLTWCRTDESQSIEIIELEVDPASVEEVGAGCTPKFDPTGDGVIGILDLPLVNDLIGYSVSDNRILIPPIRFATKIDSMDWGSAISVDLVTKFVNTIPAVEPDPIWKEKITASSETGRTGIIALDNVKAPDAFLSDKVDESFTAMRKALSKELGWDFLSQLENALLPITTPPQPGLGENWLYTGRAIAVSMNPLDASWMAVSREDYSGVTYWRVWLKCRKQDGTCGQPVHTAPWDFNARYTGSQADYQAGGKIDKPLHGYWLDYTEFASRFGWQRLPSYSNWRSYFPAGQVNVFVNVEDLSWQDALLEIYPPEAVQLLIDNQ